MSSGSRPSISAIRALAKIVRPASSKTHSPSGDAATIQR